MVWADPRGEGRQRFGLDGGVVRSSWRVGVGLLRLAATGRPAADGPGGTTGRAVREDLRDLPSSNGGRPDFAEGPGGSVNREGPADGFRNSLKHRVQD